MTIMKETLKPGLKHQFKYVVPEDKTVPHLYRESTEMRNMPEVFATAFLVGLMEWTCIQLVGPHLDDGEGSLGVAVDISHVAATPAGFTVTVDAELLEVEGRRLWFYLRAQDGVDLIGEGRHARMVVDWARFNRRVAEKSARFDPQANETTHSAGMASHG
jgi:fluoroacetyl-CoA thioesterase